MSSRRIRSTLLAAAGALPLVGAARVAFADPVERIAGLAAGANRLFALRANTVVSFDAAGRELARCARFAAAAPPVRSSNAGPAVMDAEEALRLAGLPDDELDSPEAEDVIEDEGLAPKRRPRAVLDEPIVAHAIAASPATDDVWIATSAGLYRGRGSACTRAALPHRDAIAVAAAAGAVAVASPDLLWRSDAGRTFHVAAGLSARTRALAIVDDQRTLVATDDEVIEIGPHGIARSVLDRGSDALAVCDGLAMAFTGDGVWTWTGDATPRRAGDRPPARTLTCGDDGAARFIATGESVYASTDGAAWRERRSWPGQSIAAASTIAGRIWVAVDDTVIPLEGARPSQPRVAPASTPPPPRPLAPLPTRRLAGPILPWPQLTLVFANQHMALRDGWSMVFLIGFHLGRAPASAAVRQQLAAELLRRDAELAAEEAALAAPGGEDPSRGARLRAVRQEREALR
jgi:hypothetical protein